MASRPELALSAELAEALWVPLMRLACHELRGTHEVQLASQRVQVPAFAVDGRIVWGMTLRLLDDLLREVRGRSS
jgi:hypothetical protein